MTRSIADSSTPLQQTEPATVPAVHAPEDVAILDQIAELLARREFRQPTLDLKKDVAIETQRLFRRRAALALRCGDPVFDAPAMYLAADAMISVSGAGPLLGSLSRTRRVERVRLAEAAIRTYHKALAGEVPGATRAMGQLAKADEAAVAAETDATSWRRPEC